MKKYSRVLFSVLSEGIPRCLIIQPTHWGLIRFSYWCHTRFILWRLVFIELAIFNFDVQWLLSTLLVALNQTALRFFYIKCFSGVSDIFTDKSTPHIMLPSISDKQDLKFASHFKHSSVSLNQFSTDYNLSNANITTWNKSGESRKIALLAMQGIFWFKFIFGKV